VGFFEYSVLICSGVVGMKEGVLGVREILCIFYLYSVMSNCLLYKCIGRTVGAEQFSEMINKLNLLSYLSSVSISLALTLLLN